MIFNEEGIFNRGINPAIEYVQKNGCLNCGSKIGFHDWFKIHPYKNPGMTCSHCHDKTELKDDVEALEERDKFLGILSALGRCAGKTIESDLLNSVKGPS